MTLWLFIGGAIAAFLVGAAAMALLIAASGGDPNLDGGA